jgi:hypothetical protein
VQSDLTMEAQRPTAAGSTDGGEGERPLTQTP